MGNGARSKTNYQGAKVKIKKEQGAKRDEKGAVKIGLKEQPPKNGGSRENGVKCRRDQGTWTALRTPHCVNLGWISTSHKAWLQL